jgi:hypothetical protein
MSPSLPVSITTRQFALSVALLFTGLFSSLRGVSGPRETTPSAAKLAQQQSRLLFTENKGQVADASGRPRPDILFAAHSGATQVYLTATGINYQFSKTDYPEGYEIDPRNAKDAEKQAELEKQIKTTNYCFSVELAGANTQPAVRKENKSNYFENFYLAHCSVSGVAAYGKLVYENVYPNIDWVVYSQGTHMKYDFVVHPGGDASLIKLRVKDAEGVSITRAGELLMKTSLGEVREQAPVSSANGKPVSTKFHKNSDGTIGYTIGTVPQGATLVIDPSVAWAT